MFGKQQGLGQGPSPAGCQNLSFKDLQSTLDKFASNREIFGWFCSHVQGVPQPPLPMSMVVGLLAGRGAGTSAVTHLLPAPPSAAPSAQCVQAVTQKGGGQTGSISSSASAPSHCLLGANFWCPKRFCRGKNQSPHRPGQVCVCTALSLQCRSARWQAAQARASQTLLAFVSTQLEFSYIPREMQAWRALSAHSPGCGQRWADQSMSDVSFLLESILSLA